VDLLSNEITLIKAKETELGKSINQLNSIIDKNHEEFNELNSK